MTVWDLLKNVNFQLNSFVLDLFDYSNSFKNDAVDDNGFSQLKFDDIEYFDLITKGEKSIVIIKSYIFYKTFILL